MARKKILLTAVRVGGGHIALRDFLYESLQNEEDLKLVKFDHPGKALENADALINKYIPVVHELTYFFSPRYVSNFFLIATFNFFKECYKMLKQTDPDVVLSTHFVLSMHFSLAKRLLKSKAKIVNCIPDYGPPSKVMLPNIGFFRADKTMVFEEWTYQGAIKQLKLKEKDLDLAGFNPRPMFKEVAQKFADKVEARHQLKKIFDYFPFHDIDPNKTTVLVTAGSAFVKNILPVIKDIAKSQKEDLSLTDRYQYFVICGADNKIFEQLTHKNKKFRYYSNIFPFPWVDPQVYAHIQYACDFPILGSIAPATLNELLESKCGPMLVYKTRAGQELAHRAFIEEKGLGTFIPDSKKLLNVLEQGFTNDDRESFLKKSRNFREEQAERAAMIPELVRELL